MSTATKLEARSPIFTSEAAPLHASSSGRALSDCLSAYLPAIASSRFWASEGSATANSAAAGSQRLQGALCTESPLARKLEGVHRGTTAGRGTKLWLRCAQAQAPARANLGPGLCSVRACKQSLAGSQACAAVFSRAPRCAWLYVLADGTR